MLRTASVAREFAKRRSAGLTPGRVSRTKIPRFRGWSSSDTEAHIDPRSEESDLENPKRRSCVGDRSCGLHNRCGSRICDARATVLAGGDLYTQTEAQISKANAVGSSRRSRHVQAGDRIHIAALPLEREGGRVNGLRPSFAVSPCRTRASPVMWAATVRAAARRSRRRHRFCSERAAVEPSALTAVTRTRIVLPTSTWPSR